MKHLTVAAIAVAAFVAGSFAVSSELQAFAAAMVGSADIVDNSILSIDIKDGQVKASDLGANSVTAGKIKDGEVKSAEIAQDAVGASELIGVDRLVFAECEFVTSTVVGSGVKSFHNCPVNGAEKGDNVVATSMDGCFAIVDASAEQGAVAMQSVNVCSEEIPVGAYKFSIIVYGT